jgi:hypothetical protein
MKRAIAALEHDAVPYALGGSLACWARGGPWSSNDLDVMVKPADAERALDALVRAGMRAERPPEQWLLKAWDDDALVDLIFAPAGLQVDDELLSRSERLHVAGMNVSVMALEDVLTTMLLAVNEQSLDYTDLVQIARSLREQIDWPALRARTEQSPYAAAFFSLVEALGLVAAVPREDWDGATVRLARPR